jgi:hypothetical protein
MNVKPKKIYLVCIYISVAIIALGAALLWMQL